MAEEGFLNLNLPIDQFIQCIHCPETIKIYDVNCWPLSSVNEYLIGISDRVAGCEYRDEYYFHTANVPCVISCPYCAEDIETVAQVTALPVWNHEEISEGRVPSILNFEDIVVLKVSMLFEKTTSIKECFKCDKGIENPEDFELNEFIAEDTLDSDVVPKSIVLRIIAKTTMSTRCCYLGLHESTGRIYRPIFNTFDHKCGWPSNEQLEFCMLYMFSVVANPDEKKYFTPLPHCNEDMIVSGFTILEPKVTSMNTVYKSLLQVAKSDVRDVFKDIKSRSYVEEQTDCSSAGVIRSEAMIKFNDYMEKYYCHIRCPSGPYSFPITASEYHNIGAEYGDAVIVLGLGRPYKGRKGQYKTAICSVLAVGIYSPNVQMTLVL